MTTASALTENFLPDGAVIISNGKVTTSSLKVAKAFGKRHSHVVDKIKALDCSVEFLTSNFSEVNFKHKGNDYPAWEMTKDGFMFLVMGFTGKQAALVKEAFIHTFNLMAEKLGLHYSGRPTKSDRTTTLERTPLKDAVNMLVAKRGLPYPDAYKFIHHRFGVEHLDELTKEQLPQAIEYVHRLCMEGEFIKAEPKAQVDGLTVTLPKQSYARYLVTVEDGKAMVIDAADKALIDVHVARQLANEAGAVAAYIESKAEQRDLEAKLLREESRRLRIFMGEESRSRLDKPISDIFTA